MQEKKSFSQRAEKFLNGKGFYIVLSVCIAVIGFSAWLLMFSEFSPLKLEGDEGDYVATMGEVDVPSPFDAVTPDTPAPEPAPAPDLLTPTPDTEPVVPIVPEKTLTPAPSESDALTVTEGSPEAEPEPVNPKKTSSPAAPPVEKTLEEINFIWPLTGSVSVPYSPEVLLYDRTMGDWRAHDGMDLAAPLGTKVMTVADGTVADVYEDELYGTTVIIDHGAGASSRYSNLTAVPTVNIGDAVTMGSVIGAIGDTALCETGEVTHLHFTLTVDGKSVDPAEFLPKR